MKVKAKFAEEREIDIDSAEAFRILCHVLGMPYVLSEDAKFEIRRCKESTEGFSVFVQENDGHFMRYDDRAKLFSALRNIAVNIFPNVYFRGDHYIDTRWDDEKS